eukprot:843059_1
MPPSDDLGLSETSSRKFSCPSLHLRSILLRMRTTMTPQTATTREVGGNGSFTKVNAQKTRVPFAMASNGRYDRKARIDDRSSDLPKVGDLDIVGCGCVNCCDAIVYVDNCVADYVYFHSIQLP